MATDMRAVLVCPLTVACAGGDSSPNCRTSCRSKSYFWRQASETKLCSIPFSWPGVLCVTCAQFGAVRKGRPTNPVPMKALVEQAFTGEDLGVKGEDGVIVDAEENLLNEEQVDYSWETEWYPLYLTNEIPRQAPLALKVFDRSLVLFYDGDGTLNCLEDRCPHRNGLRFFQRGRDVAMAVAALSAGLALAVFSKSNFWRTFFVVLLSSCALRHGHALEQLLI